MTKQYFVTVDFDDHSESNIEPIRSYNSAMLTFNRAVREAKSTGLPCVVKLASDIYTIESKEINGGLK